MSEAKVLEWDDEDYGRVRFVPNEGAQCFDGKHWNPIMSSGNAEDVLGKRIARLARELEAACADSIEANAKLLRRRDALSKAWDDRVRLAARVGELERQLNNEHEAATFWQNKAVQAENEIAAAEAKGAREMREALCGHLNKTGLPDTAASMRRLFALPGEGGEE